MGTIKLTTLKKIQVGSKAFFSAYPDFQAHDSDWVEFVKPDIALKAYFKLSLPGQCIFLHQKLSKDKFLLLELNHVKNTPMAVGKLLVPELCEYMNISIEDLKLFESAFDNIDDKHKYEKCIFDSYVKNNGIFLTDEQRDEAYNLYKQYRS